MGGNYKDLLAHTRKHFKDRVGWRCISVCARALCKNDEDLSQDPQFSVETLCDDVQDVLGFLEQLSSDESQEDEMQQILYYLGVSLLRVGFHNEAKRFLEATVGGPLNKLAKVNLELCDFVKQSTESTKSIAENTLTPVDLGNIKVDWYESSTSISFCIYAKKSSPNAIKIKASENLVVIFIALRNSTAYLYDFPFMAHEIIPDSVKISVTEHRIEVKVDKKVANITWKKLQTYSGVPAEVLAFLNGSSSSTLDSPASLYKKRTLWEEEIKKLDDEGVDGIDSVDQMFKNIFENASEDGKKAMLKSFVESSGTCLSTNWDEVSKKKVDVVPPEGTIAKKFPS